MGQHCHSFMNHKDDNCLQDMNLVGFFYCVWIISGLELRIVYIIMTMKKFGHPKNVTLFLGDDTSWLEIYQYIKNQYDSARKNRVVSGGVHIIKLHGKILYEENIHISASGVCLDIVTDDKKKTYIYRARNSWIEWKLQFNQKNDLIPEPHFLFHTDLTTKKNLFWLIIIKVNARMINKNLLACHNMIGIFSCHVVWYIRLRISL